MKHYETKRMKKKNYNEAIKRHGLVEPMPIVYKAVTGRHYRGINVLRARYMNTRDLIRKWNRGIEE